MPVRPVPGAHIDFGPACERKGRAQAALGYNALAQFWPQIARLNRAAVNAAVQATLTGRTGGTQ